VASRSRSGANRSERRAWGGWGTLAQYQDYLEHNELELALDELADVGVANSPPVEFWRKLCQAAENMELTEHVAKFERKLRVA
jgi:hypothetical protein